MLHTLPLSVPLVWLVPPPEFLCPLTHFPSTLSSHSCKPCPFLRCLFQHGISHRSTTGPPSRSGICQADLGGVVKIGEVRVRKSRCKVRRSVFPASRLFRNNNRHRLLNLENKTKTRKQKQNALEINPL